MNEMVRWLERQGRVGRRPDGVPPRILRLSLADHGRALLERCDPALAELEDELLASMPVSERPVFRRHLETGYASLGLRSEE